MSRRKGSYIATHIDREYKQKLMYEKRKSRVNCKEKDCNKCQFQYICDEKNDT